MIGHPDGPRDETRPSELPNPADEFIALCQRVATINPLTPTSGFWEFPGGAYLYSGTTDDKARHLDGTLAFAYVIEGISPDESQGFHVEWIYLDHQRNPHKEVVNISAYADTYLAGLLGAPYITLSDVPEQMEQEAYARFFEHIRDEVRFKLEGKDPDVSQLNLSRFIKEVEVLRELIDEE